MSGKPHTLYRWDESEPQKGIYFFHRLIFITDCIRIECSRKEFPETACLFAIVSAKGLARDGREFRLPLRKPTPFTGGRMSQVVLSQIFIICFLTIINPYFWSWLNRPFLFLFDTFYLPFSKFPSNLDGRCCLLFFFCP